MTISLGIEVHPAIIGCLLLKWHSAIGNIIQLNTILRWSRVFRPQGCQHGKWCQCGLAEAVWVWVVTADITSLIRYILMFITYSCLSSDQWILCSVQKTLFDYSSAKQRESMRCGLFARFKYLWSNLKTIFPEMKSLVFAIEIVVIFHIQ